MRRISKSKVLLAATGAVAVICFAMPAAADPLRSPNYEFTEQSLGSSGLYGSQSANYQSDSAVGILGLGNSASTNIQVNAGNITTGDPALTFIVNSSDINFGDFSAAAATTSTATFSVIDYTSFGYIVQLFGSPPTYNGHTIPGMNNGSGGATASVPGTEQFGINLVKNTNFCGAGCDLGADPNYGQFGATSAVPTANYDTANLFYYNSGDTIVQSPKSSGQINYTISFVVNVKELTPGGIYTGGQTLLCTGTY